MGNREATESERVIVDRSLSDLAIRDASDFSRLAERARERNYAIVIIATQRARCFGGCVGRCFTDACFPRRGSNGARLPTLSHDLSSAAPFPSIFADRTGYPSQPHLARPC